MCSCEAMSPRRLGPGDGDYDAARRPQVARFAGVRPAAVARCRTAADVDAALALARRAGGGLAVRAGGHCVGGRSSTTGVLLDVAPLDGGQVGDGR